MLMFFGFIVCNFVERKSFILMIKPLLIKILNYEKVNKPYIGFHHF